MTPEATLLLAWLDEADAPAWVADGVADALPKIETAIEAEATATLEAEVSRLRAALAMTTDALDVWVTGSHRVVDGRCPHRSDGPCTSHRVVAEARAALAAAPAVAPDPAPPAPDERCEDCAGNFVDGYCRRHEPSFHGYNGAVSVPEPVP